MRWFKHMTCSLRDPKIAQLIARKGMAGFGSYWAVLETIAEHVDERGITSASYPLRHWQRVLGMYHARHALDMLRTMADLNLILLRVLPEPEPTPSEPPPNTGPTSGQLDTNLGSNLGSTSPQLGANIESTSHQQPGNIVFVDMPNILKSRDEWTRKRRKTPEPLRSKDTDTDTEREEDNTPPSPPVGGGAPVDDPPQPARKPVRSRRAAPCLFPPELEDIWKSCHPAMRACGRISALNSWNKQKKAGVLPDQDVLLRALCQYREVKEAQAEPKVAHLSTWLNAGRWDIGEEIEGQTMARLAAEREAADQGREEAEQKRKAADKAWAEAWEKLPETVKDEWRARATERNSVLAQAKERGEIAIIDLVARSLWRKWKEEQIMAKRREGSAARGQQ